MTMMFSSLEDNDPELADLLKEECTLQEEGLELIASENYTSRAVLDCLGSCLTNKYSEGQVGQRYYGGTGVIDKIEKLCQDRALNAFGLDETEWGVNVQPYSGSPANFAVYVALLEPNERLMGMYLTHGGHLTHGFQTPKRKVSATSIFWDSTPYRINKETDLIDYDVLEKLVIEKKPKILIAGFSCYTRRLDFARFREIADKVGAILMTDMAHVAGLIASDLYPSPFPYSHIVTTTTHKTLRGPRSGVIFYSKKPGPNNEDFGSKINAAVFPGLQGGPHNNVIAGVATCFKQVATPEFKTYSEQVIRNSRTIANYFLERNKCVITNGTDNHIVVLNLVKSFEIDGKQGEEFLDYAGIVVNKNSCSSDKSVLRPSCIRIGSPALTSRGLDEKDFIKVSHFMSSVLTIGGEIIKGYREKNITPPDVKEILKLEEFKEEKLQLQQIKKEIIQFIAQYPIPHGLQLY